MRSLVLRGTIFTSLLTGLILSVLTAVACDGAPELKSTFIWLLPFALVLLWMGTYLILKKTMRPV